MPTESSAAAKARRGRHANGATPPLVPDLPDRHDEQAETSSSSARVEEKPSADRSAGSLGKSQSPGKAATVRVDARTSIPLGASAQQPPWNGDHSARSSRQAQKGSKSKASRNGLWSRSAGAATRQVASAPLVSWPGAAVLVLAIGLGTWLPSQRGGEPQCALLPGHKIPRPQLCELKRFKHIPHLLGAVCCSGPVTCLVLVGMLSLHRSPHGPQVGSAACQERPAMRQSRARGSRR